MFSMKLRRVLLSFILIALTVACSEQKEQTNTETDVDLSSLSIPEQIDALIAIDKYDEALAILEEEEVNKDNLRLKEKVHLNYGIYIIYNADPSQMRENANNGLRQFIAVLDINRNNDKAVSEIEQIMGIYSTFPDRSPAEDVMEDLRRLGFNY